MDRRPVEDMTAEEIRAEREAIAAERARIAEQKAKRNGREVVSDNRPRSEDVVVEQLTLFPEADPEEIRHGVAEISREMKKMSAAIHHANGEVRPESTVAPKDAPEPWPYEHLTHCGLELEVRVPGQSALMAVSMLNQLDGNAELQMGIFNAFLKNHMSTAALATVAAELTDPDTEMTVEGLIGALVKMRTDLE